MHNFTKKFVSYVCPECRKRYNVELTIIPDNPSANLEKGRWCRCGARHKLTYKIHKKRDGDIQLSVVEFVCNDEIKPKRFRKLD